MKRSTTSSDSRWRPETQFYQFQSFCALTRPSQVTYNHLSNRQVKNALLLKLEENCGARCVGTLLDVEDVIWNELGAAASEVARALGQRQQAVDLCSQRHRAAQARGECRQTLDQLRADAVLHMHMSLLSFDRAGASLRSLVW